MSKRWGTGPAPALAACLVGFLALAGCDDPGAGGPPAAATQSAGAEVKAIEVLLPDSGPVERVFWDQTMRLQANDLGVGLEVRQLSPGATPQEQAEMIRDAARRKVSALVVVPAEAGTIAPALAEARDGGTPVVVLGTPVTVPGKPIPLVVIANEAESLEKLVGTAAEAARENFFSARGPAVLLAQDPVDDHKRSRMDAIAKSLQAKGIEVLPEVHFKGLVEPAIAALKTRIEERPDLALVIGMDDQAVGGACVHRHNLKAGLDHRFVVAGVITEQASIPLVEAGQCVALVDVNLRGPAAEALRAAVNLANGQPAPERIDVRCTMLTPNGPERNLFPFAPGTYQADKGRGLDNYLSPGPLDGPPGVKERAAADAIRKEVRDRYRRPPG